MQSEHDPIEIQVDGQTPESWSCVLSHFSDSSIYQTWAYGAVRWGGKNLSHLLLRQKDRILAAAQLRIARVPVLPAGIAYIRWGPMWQSINEPANPAILQRMLQALRHEYGERRGLALQILPNVFVGDDRSAHVQAALAATGLKPDFTLGTYRTITVDLAADPVLLRKHLDQKWRNQLNRSEKNGLTLEASNTPEAYAEFVWLYRIMWEKKQFDTSVNAEEFARIQEQLGAEEKMIIFLARKDGKAIAALVCSLLGDSSIYLLGATDDIARELKASYFLQWQAMLWLKENGALSYDLGGIDPDTNPGGYHFKSGFGGTERAHLTPHAHTEGMLNRAVTIFSTMRRKRQQPTPVPPKKPAPPQNI